MKNRLRPFAIPTTLFALALIVTFWRVPRLDRVLDILLLTLVETLGALAVSAAFGALCLLVLWLHNRLNRRPLANPAAAFLSPTLVLFTLFAVLFLWLQLGFAFDDRALARMDRAWTAAPPATKDDVRRLFGDPDDLSSADRWFYYPSRFPALLHAPPFQVWFSPDGTVASHGHR